MEGSRYVCGVLWCTVLHCTAPYCTVELKESGAVGDVGSEVVLSMVVRGSIRAGMRTNSGRR